MTTVEVKKIDPQGRLVLPKSWRKRWGDEVIIVEFEDRIEIIPRKKPRLSRFFDIIDAEVKGTDLEKELLESLH